MSKQTNNREASSPLLLLNKTATNKNQDKARGTKKKSLKNNIEKDIRKVWF